MRTPLPGLVTVENCADMFTCIMYMYVSGSCDSHVTLLLSRYTKLGYAGETEPKYIIPSCK